MIVEVPYLLISPGAVEVHQIAMEMKIALRFMMTKNGMIYLAQQAQVAQAAH